MASQQRPRPAADPGPGVLAAADSADSSDSPDSPEPEAAVEAEARAQAMVLAETQAWLDRVVIGLDLCPFAKAARTRQRTRFVCTASRSPEGLLAVFCEEVQFLAATAAAQVETTLLVHPFVLQNFGEYNDFLDILDAAVDALGCTGVLQVASFHPDYCFEGTAADDISNATNRSPYPMLQLLREESVAAAAVAFPESATIYEANIATMLALGPSGWAALQAECKRDAEAAVRGGDPR